MKNPKPAQAVQICPPMVEPNPWGEPTTHMCGLRAGHTGRHRCSATASCGMTWGETAERNSPATADEIRRRLYPVRAESIPPTHPAASASALEEAEIISESEEFAA